MTCFSSSIQLFMWQAWLQQILFSIKRHAYLLVSIYKENTFSIDNFSYVHIIVYILTIVFLVRVARVCFYYVCLLYSLWDFNEVFVLSCLVFYWNISRFVFSLVFSIYIFFYRKTFLKYVLWLVFTQHGYSLIDRKCVFLSLKSHSRFCQNNNTYSH
jgi:hypothetical protein